jgi:hypothetical protein
MIEEHPAETILEFLESQLWPPHSLEHLMARAVASIESERCFKRLVVELHHPDRGVRTSVRCQR